jgi:hypothetical protein
MFKKVAFSILIIICLFLTLNIVDALSLDNSQIDSSAYFDQRDSTVFIVNHPNNVDFNIDNIRTIDVNKDLFQSIKKDIPENCSVFLSQSRGLIVFEKSGNWNKASIKELFIDGKFKIEFTELRHFKYGPFTGFYSKNKLILHTKEVDPKKCSDGFIIDKKAHYCRVTFDNKTPITKDFYKSKNETISYHTLSAKSSNYENVNDKDVFSHFISDNFDSYTFYAKEYFADLDEFYRKSPLYPLTASGVLILEEKGNMLAVLELKNGQKCNETLVESSDNTKQSGNYSYLPELSFSKFIDEANNGGYYVADIDGYAIISKSKVLFDRVSTEIKLGNVLLKKKNKMDRLYNSLPQSVLHRKVNQYNEISVSKVGNILVQTEIIDDQSESNTPENDSKDYFVMNPRERIESFYAYSGRGNTFLITASNKWIKYENGLSQWEKTFEKEVIKEPKLMEMSSNENPDISILFKDETFIVDKGGRILNRFNTSGGVHPIRMRLKNKVAFLIPNINKMEVVDYDGEIMSTYSFSSNIEDMVLFKENGKKHVAVLCEKILFIINLERKRTVRKITLDEVYTLYQFQESSFIMNNDQSHIINLKGEKNAFSVPSDYSFKNAYQKNDVVYLIFSKENEILVLNNKSQFQWKKTINCSSIDKIIIPTLQSSYSNKIILGILDGIENKILLLDSQGSSIDDVKRHGEKDLQITNYGNQGISITTFLGDYLIQYAKF